MTARDDLLTDAELAVYTRGDDDDRYRQRPSRLRYAHTSPIYVTVDGQDTAVRKSIEEGLQMLARFEVLARRKAAPQYLPSVLQTLQKAKQKLERRLKEATLSEAKVPGN